LGTYEFSINRVVVYVLIQQVCEQIKVLALSHSLIGDLDDSFEAIHDLLPILHVMTVVQGRGKSQSLTLVWLLQQS
jgi:hypothetical protein